MARIVEASNTYTMNVRTNADSLGQLLGSVKTDWKRIGMDILLRIVMSALVLFVWSRSGNGTGALDLICDVGLLVFTLYPLIHCRDTMQFYENGIMFKNSTFLFCSQQVQWLHSEGVGHILPGTYLRLAGSKKQINASYLQDPQGAFAIAYQNFDLR